ncbi:hypothetical protein GCM10027184_18440 [Saccharothrix stipae]
MVDPDVRAARVDLESAGTTRARIAAIEDGTPHVGTGSEKTCTCDESPP